MEQLPLNIFQFHHIKPISYSSPLTVDYETPIIDSEYFPGEIVYDIPVHNAEGRRFPLSEYETHINLNDQLQHDNVLRPARILRVNDQYTNGFGVLYNASHWFVKVNVFCGIHDYMVHDHYCHRPNEIIYTDSVSIVNHQWPHAYGHAIGDILPMVSVSPSYYIQRSLPSVSMVNRSVIYSLLVPAIGYKDYIATQNLIFAREILLFEPSPCSTNPDYMHQVFRRSITPHLALDQTKPYQYLLIQRTAKSREIHNFDEVLTALRSKWPSFNWKERTFLSLKDDIHQFNTARLIFGIHGADFANAIFMQEGTVMCEIQASNFNPMYIEAALSTQKLVVAGRNNSIQHFVYSYNILRLDYVVGMIRKAFNLLDRIS